MDLQKFLPSSTFVPFLANRLTKAKVVYVNLPLFHEYNYFNDFQSENNSLYEAILDNFAYIVPVTEEDRAIVENTNKEFFAERYGGIGILANGGGARCGLIDQFQIKGIGPTPVVGEGVSYWYSHGGMALHDALSELLYSNAADIALPYQNSRVLAVIDTGGYVLQRAYKNRADEDKDERQKVRRALIIRESKIRPAHFARAFYFKPSPYMKEHQPHDYQRVADAIPLLPELVGDCPSDLNKGQKFNHAIKQILARAAVQLSYSKVRRLMHGSLTTSNFLIDGGWVDFGSVTVVPAYGQLITATQQPPFWDEINLFEKTSIDLCFYVSKFQPEIKSYIDDGSKLFTYFLDIYIRQLRVLFVELTGFPLIFARRIIDNTNYESLGRMLVHIARNEDPQPHISEWVLQCCAPAHRWKKNSLRSVLQKLFYAYWIVRREDAPELPFNSQFNRELWGAYKSVSLSIERIAREQGASFDALAQFIGLNMGRQNIGLKNLYRGHVFESVHRIIENSQSDEELYKCVNDICRKSYALSYLHYYVPMSNELLIAKNADSVNLFWDSTFGQYRLEIPEEVAIKFCSAALTDSFCLILNAKSLVFQYKPKNSIFLVFFGCAGSDFLHHLSEIVINGDFSIPLMSLFPDNEDTYLAYKAIFDGEDPPAEIDLV